MPKSLQQLGILGVNARNLEYLFPHNPRHLYKLADSKLETKRIAREVGAATPETYGVIRFQNEVRRLCEIAGDRAFAIKPACGSGGDGIVVIKGRDGSGYRKVSGKFVSLDDLHYHLHNILSGMFSLSGSTDTAIVEYAVRFDPVFSEVAYQGVPDIRTIIYCGVPVMAMLRLPTKISDGKANLHRGGVGVGIDIAIGKTTTGIQHNRYIETHPETGKPLGDIAIPHWEQILQMSARMSDKTEFGYLGVDIVLDEQLGPLLLEINARPGLSIQISNRTGLRSRLDAVDRSLSELGTTDEKIAFAQREFDEAKFQN